MNKTRPNRSIIGGTLLLISSVISPILYSAENNELYERALISYNNGDIDESKIHVLNLLQQNSEHRAARILLAQIHINKGDGAAAQQELDKARSNSVDMDRLVNLYAQAYLLQNKFDQAIEVTTPGNRNKRIESELALYRGQAYIGNNQLRRADKSFDYALNITPNNQVALLGKAQIAASKDDFAKAYEFIEQALNQPEPFINGLIMKANIQLVYGDFVSAENTFKEALAIDDNHFSVHLSMASLYIQTERYSEANKHVNVILEEIPNEPRAGYLKAVIDANLAAQNGSPEQMDLSEVITTLTAVPEEIMKSTPDYYYLAGLTHFKAGNLSDARRYLISYLKHNEFDYDSTKMLAIIDIQSGEFNSAKSILTRYNLSYPNNPNILMLLGVSYLELGEADRAQTFFEQVVEMQPNSEVGITNLARSKLESGQYDSAIDSLLKIKNNEVNGFEVKMLLVNSFEENANYQSAEKILAEMVEGSPNDSYLRMRHATILGKAGNVEKARDGYQKAIEIDSKNVLAIAYLARLDFENKSFEEGFSRINKALVKNSNNPLLMAELGAGYVIAGEADKGLQWLQKAYAVDRNDFQMLSRLVSGLKSQGQINEAIDEVDAFIGRNSRMPDAYELISSLYIEQRKYKQAVLALQAAADKTNNKPEVLVKLAKVQLQIPDVVGATQTFKQAIISNDKYVPAYLGLINILTKEDEENFALSLISQVNQITNNDSLTKMLKGDLYLRLGKAKEARLNYHESLKVKEQSKAILGLYSAYKMDGLFAEAVPILEEWVNKYPEDLFASISLADSYKRSGDLEKSTEIYENAIDRFGDIPAIMNNLANNYFLIGEEDKALALARKAASYVSNNVAIMDTLGWIESRMGNHQEALALFRRALTIDYDNIEVKYHLAATLHKLGRDKEAKELLGDILDSQQSFSERADAIKLNNTI